MKFLTIMVCMLGLTFQMNAHEIISQNNSSETLSTESQEKTQSQELVVSLQDLDITPEGISIKSGESSYEVYSLKQHGNQWIAKIAGALRCPWGHSLCGICNMCPKRICPDWQPRTAQCAPVE